MIYISTKIQAAIYEILCDEDVFPIETFMYFRDIAKIIVPKIKQMPEFQDMNPDNIEHNLSQVLQTRNNCIRNTNRHEYIQKGAIVRDISSVMVSPKRNKYCFGCLYKEGEPIK